MSVNRGARVDVVLDLILVGDTWRVRMVGVLDPKQPSPPLPDGPGYRNRVQAFFGVQVDVPTFGIPASHAPEAADETTDSADYRACGAEHPTDPGWHCDLPDGHNCPHFAAIDGYYMWEAESATRANRPATTVDYDDDGEPIEWPEEWNEE